MRDSSAKSLENDPHLRRLARYTYKWHNNEFLDWEYNDGVYFVFGPRQVGKSTHCKLLIKSKLETLPTSNVLYFSCDLLNSKNALATVLTTFFEQIRDPRQRCYVILDEITTIEDSILAIKYMVDNGFDENITYILTGSSSVNVKKTGEYLPGRRGHGRDFIPRAVKPRPQ